MPESLLESELFGYEKGSFTDARSDKKGLFELAKGGTLLLDEIGEMKMDIQSKLLRVLEERKIRPIGGKFEIPIDAKVIVTTNRNLSKAVKDGDFRKDLFFRLSPFYFHIAPLRERKADIPLLSKHFLSFFTTKYNKQIIKGFSSKAEALLMNYSWPGNVRELKNLIERLVVLENSELLLPEHLPHWLFGQQMNETPTSVDRLILPEDGISLDDLERDLIVQALEKAKNNKTRAAKLLRMSYDSFRYQLKKFGLQ
jgi:transcriptional regulator with PAS, ATPase and Fis domain